MVYEAEELAKILRGIIGKIKASSKDGEETFLETNHDHQPESTHDPNFWDKNVEYLKSRCLRVRTVQKNFT